MHAHTQAQSRTHTSYIMLLQYTLVDLFEILSYSSPVAEKAYIEVSQDDLKRSVSRCYLVSRHVSAHNIYSLH